jgi:hypothetical protein
MIFVFVRRYHRAGSAWLGLRVLVEELEDDLGALPTVGG